MKKTVAVLALLASVLCVWANDACYDVYLNALKAYNAKNYIEAQRKFLLVAESCGNYQEVYQKMRDCNAKIKEQQTSNVAEISSVKTQNKNLLEQHNSVKSEYSELQKSSASRIYNLEGIVNSTKDQLDKTNTDLVAANNTIEKLRGDTALLHHQLDSLKFKYDSLQNSLELYKRKHRFNIVQKDTALLPIKPNAIQGDTISEVTTEEVTINK